MLESASRSNEGHAFFAGKADRAQSAFHAAIRAARSAPDRIAFCQARLGGSVVQRIGIQPQRFGRNSESFCGMRNGLFSRYMIFVLRIIIGNDSDANCAFHISGTRGSWPLPRNGERGDTESCLPVSVVNYESPASQTRIVVHQG